MISRAFLEPAYAPLLLLAPVAGLLLWMLSRRRAARLAREIGPRWQTLGGREPGRRNRILFAVALLLLALAAMAPVVGTEPSAEAWEGIDLVLCLDVSRSMLARDVAPSRLALAKQQILALAKRATGDRLALYAFAGESRRIAPLTRDLVSFAHLLEPVDPLSVRRGGTDLGAAIDSAVAGLPTPRVRPVAIVILTDGEDLDGGGLAAAERAADAGLVVHTVGIGTRLGSKIALEVRGAEVFLQGPDGRDVISKMDAPSLQRLAARTGGTFSAAGHMEDSLARWHETEILPLATHAGDGGGPTTPANRYQWCLALALLCLFLDAGLHARRAGR